jgi:nitroreductase
MDVTQAIATRRAYRSFVPGEISDDLIHDLARHAGLAPSCSNMQPWRFIFVRSAEALTALHEALNPTNAWMKAASALVAVCGRPDEDCVIKDREYVLFDLGLASAFLILRATELGLVAHPVAGFSPKKTREVLRVPEEYRVISLIALGRKADTVSPVLSPKQAHEESERPARLPLEHFVFVDRFADSVSPARNPT